MFKNQKAIAWLLAIAVMVMGLGITAPTGVLAREGKYINVTEDMQEQQVYKNDYLSIWGAMKIEVVASEDSDEVLYETITSSFYVPEALAGISPDYWNIKYVGKTNGFYDGGSAGIQYQAFVIKVWPGYDVANVEEGTTTMWRGGDTVSVGDFALLSYTTFDGVSSSYDKNNYIRNSVTLPTLDELKTSSEYANYRAELESAGYDLPTITGIAWYVKYEGEEYINYFGGSTMTPTAARKYKIYPVPTHAVTFESCTDLEYDSGVSCYYQKMKMPTVAPLNGDADGYVLKWNQNMTEPCYDNSYTETYTAYFALKTPELELDTAEGVLTNGIAGEKYYYKYYGNETATDEGKIDIPSDIKQYSEFVTVCRLAPEGETNIYVINSDYQTMMIHQKAPNIVVDSYTATSISVHDANGMDNVKYAVSTEWDYDTVTSWQDSGTFTGLTPETTYYVFAYVPQDAHLYKSYVSCVDVTTPAIKAVSDAEPNGVSMDSIADQVWTGSAIEPTVAVKDGTTVLTSDDYTVAYSNNTNLGEATVTVTFKGNYSGSLTKTFNIAAKAVSDAESNGVSIDTIADQVWTGSAIEPTVTVKDGTTVLTSDDYTVAYSNNTNLGEATVTVTFKGNYSGSLTKTFNIAAKAVSDVEPNGVSMDSIADQSWTGSTIEPTVTVKDGTTVLTSGDYIVAYSNNTNAGEATVTVTFKGNYSGSLTKTFNIAAKAVSDAEPNGVSMDSIADQSWTGSAIEPTVTVKDGTTVLTSDDYTVAYSNNTNLGEATVTVTFKGNYSGSLTKTFNIAAKAVSDVEPNGVSMDSIADQSWTGSTIEPTVTVKDGTTVLTSDDYTVAYSNNTNLGEATVTITFKGNYSGSLTKTFNIAAKAVSDTKPNNVSMDAISDQVWTGSAIEPTVTVKDGTTVLTSDDYTIAYSANITAGEAMVTVTFKGNYSGSLTRTFVINKKSPALEFSCADVNYGVALTPVVSKNDSGATVTYQYKVSSADDSTYANGLPINAGTYTIKATTDATEGYSEQTTTVTVTIKKAMPNMTTAPSVSRMVKGSNLSTANIKAGVITDANGRALEGSYAFKTDETMNTVGVFERTLTFTPNDANYMEIEIPVSVTIYRRSSGTAVINSGSPTTSTSTNTNTNTTDETKKDDETNTTTNDNTTSTKPNFTDVKTSDWFYDAVQYMVEKGYIAGSTAKEFMPNNPVTRGMFVTVLYRMENEPNVDASSFADVKDDSYYAKAIAWASKNGIVSGFSGSEYRPNDPITREQLAAMIYRYMKFKGMDVTVNTKTNYADKAKVSDWASEAVAYCNQIGVMTGDTKNSFNPQATATRAQMVSVLKRVIDLANAE